MNLSSQLPSAATREDLHETFVEFRRTGDRALRSKLVEDHRWIARVVAVRFANRGEPVEDLEQVGLVGVLKAVDRFDPERGISFVSFAIPTVTGEIRRHFRDSTWSLKVNRRAKELHVRVPRAIEQLSQSLGRAPNPDELARRLDVTIEEVLEAMDAQRAYRPGHLDVNEGGVAAGRSGSVDGHHDPRFAAVEARMVLSDAMARLPVRQRRILELRFVEGLSQSEIGNQIGISQVHVSRLLRQASDRLRRTIGSIDAA